MATCFCLQRLPNVPYQHPRLAVMGPHERGHWAFSCHGVEGMNVSDAHAGRLQDLDGHDDELFPACFSRVTCLIAVRNLSSTTFV
ncbi:uncharacterized protein PHACADRAFT_258708 [Phanerochaete carnosa HHB-10118-sp]|uniref:Uncharacterized protein n=1 Tax=Phanerochaete carnosa (strain HHB-10118-sp) TaxID=650164 RepID=K5W6V9_PHACS|nr:uncharacterized protein PHACADRAFT_258708 [Phanerochaete carnosa HHB-10118-sp]EKM54694.1 hypothetical protein PHACADRAFT_258708 [Phanerochaete carnosa HHB-10118-sp]